MQPCTTSFTSVSAPTGGTLGFAEMATVRIHIRTQQPFSTLSAIFSTLSDAPATHARRQHVMVTYGIDLANSPPGHVLTERPNR